MPPSQMLQRIAGLRAAVESAPKVVAAKLQQLTRQTQIKQVGPDGTPWQPTNDIHTISRANLKAAGIRKLGTLHQGRDAKGRYTSKEVQTRDFDPLRHIQYESAVHGNDATLSTAHKAARYTRWGTKWMPARPKVPGTGGLGWWEPLIYAAVRGHLRRKKSG